MTALMEKIRQEHKSIAEEVSQLFRETHEFLSATTANREEQAKKQAQYLHQFQQNLEQTTHEFLAETAKNRTEQAKAQKQYLHQFRQDLFVSIFGTHI
ncbi:gas vesicle protein GvpC [Nostoc punctiforme NIES-2108]|uniref:Gas vesicle protein C n=1 Tax=Nostoc punctiforme NIES-2108 TaxID=1356359 RepID=A0A367RF89_NOSPU|nr:gas vesicle protein GvpC [Nostoc punctiforme NIES-2108]